MRPHETVYGPGISLDTQITLRLNDEPEIYVLDMTLTRERWQHWAECQVDPSTSCTVCRHVIEFLHQYRRARGGT